MSCFNPLLRIVYKNGKTVITSLGDEDKEGFSTVERAADAIEMTPIPCRRCLGCQADYAKEWSYRLLLEKESWEESWFVTLTFDDDHYVDQCGSEGTLKVEHLQKFFKRLRKETKQKLKFFACGEYGDRHLRAHYHAIIFGLHLPVVGLHYQNQNEFGDDLFSSDLISKCWPFGFNLCGSVTFRSCSYVARYVMKKAFGRDGLIYELQNRKPPFIVMSRNPGIGFKWYDEHPEWVNSPYIYVVDGDEVKRFVPPKAFEDRLRREDPELFEKRKLLRRDFSNDREELRHDVNGLSRYQYAQSVGRDKQKSYELLTIRDKV